MTLPLFSKLTASGSWDLAQVCRCFAIRQNQQRGIECVGFDHIPSGPRTCLNLITATHATADLNVLPCRAKSYFAPPLEGRTPDRGEAPTRTRLSPACRR